MTSEPPSKKARFDKDTGGENTASTMAYRQYRVLTVVGGVAAFAEIMPPQLVKVLGSTCQVFRGNAKEHSVDLKALLNPSDVCKDFEEFKAWCEKVADALGLSMQDISYGAVIRATPIVPISGEEAVEFWHYMVERGIEEDNQTRKMENLMLTIEYGKVVMYDALQTLFGLPPAGVVETALAARHDQKEMAQYFLYVAGAPFDDSAVYAAVEGKAANTLQWIVNHLAELGGLQLSTRASALAAQAPERVKCLEILLEANCPAQMCIYTAAINNNEQGLKVLFKRREKFPGQVVCPKEASRALARCDMHIVEYALKNEWFPKDDESLGHAPGLMRAAEDGNVELAEDFLKYGERANVRVACAAVQNGRHAKGFLGQFRGRIPVDGSVSAIAAEVLDDAAFKWLIDVFECPVDARAYPRVVSRGFLCGGDTRLKYLHDDKGVVDDLGHGVRAAVHLNEVELLKLMLDRDFIVDVPWSLSVAADNGHLDVLKVLFELPLPDDDEEGAFSASWNPFVNAARGGHLHVLQFMHGAPGMQWPMSPRALEEAIMYEHEDVVEWLLDNNCPLSHEAYVNAVIKGDEKLIERLEKMGCPDKPTWAD